jgi:hypothetical protein
MSCGVLAGWLSQMGLPPLLPVALLVLFVGPALACVVMGKMGVVHARDGLASGVAAAASFGIYWSAAIYFKTEDNPRWVLWVVPALALAVFGIPSALLAGGLTEVVRRDVRRK